ncbi:MAG: hypothetical protein K0B85_06315 [Coriobacteriia bacterium]|nr:hypothetical protein [Coriobacteriia bacterium]
MSEQIEMDPKDFRQMLKQIGESADARTVFGETVISGERAVIPVARVHHKGGGGFGGGGGTAAHECTPECPPGCEEGTVDQGYGTGMGLGYMISAEPVGVIEVTPEGVWWNPTIDMNRLAIVGAVAGAAIAVLFALGRALRR